MCSKHHQIKLNPLSTPLSDFRPLPIYYPTLTAPAHAQTSEAPQETWESLRRQHQHPPHPWYDSKWGSNLKGAAAAAAVDVPVMTAEGYQREATQGVGL